MMLGALQSDRFRPFAAAGVFGIWAAAIAVAPDLAAKAILVAPALLFPLLVWTLAQPHRWLLLFFAAALLLPPLPIAIGDSGPHPSLVCAGIGIFASILYARRWRLDIAGPGRPLLVLFAVLVLSIAPAAFYSGALPAAASAARVALFGISILVYFQASPAIRPSVLYWLAAAAALFACVDFYFQFPAPAGYGPQFVWLESGVYRRAQGLFYEASTLGNFCAFFLVMIAVAFSRPRADAPVSRKALLLGGAVFFAALVLSYSRGSLINLAIALAVLLWWNRSRVRLARALPPMAVLAAAAAWLTWNVFPAFAEVYWRRLSASAEYLFTATEGVLSGRVASWRLLVAWVTDHPWQTVFGIGYKTLPYTDYLGGGVVADNMYFSLLIETGVAGLAALIWLNVAILRAAARAARLSDPRRAFYGLWMLCFWSGEVVQLASGDLLTYWRVLPVYFWVLALASRA